VPAPRAQSQQRGGLGQAVLPEEVRRRIRDLVVRPIGIAGAFGRVERVANRDLVRDDEDRLLRTREHRLEPATVAGGRSFEALAAGKGVAACVRALPRTIFLDRLALEVADVHVVEERLHHERHVASGEGDLRSLACPPEPRHDAQVERDVAELLGEQLRLGAPFLRKRDVHGRVAVDDARGVEHGFSVPGEHEQAGRHIRSFSGGGCTPSEPAGRQPAAIGEGRGIR
jgi:hypothetical protein